MKFYRNDVYTLKHPTGILRYRCIAIINTVNGVEINAVVMKLLNENVNKQKFCLNRYDCRRLHIKYQEGLECFSNKLNFRKETLWNKNLN